MTLSETISIAPPLASMNQIIEVRWPSLVSSPFDAFGVCEAHGTSPPRSHGRIELVLSIQLLASDHAMLESWIDLPKGRRTILPHQPLAICTSMEYGQLHLDCEHEGECVIALSLSQDHDILYARSNLPARAGFAVGSYDPPTIRRIEIEREVASA